MEHFLRVGVELFPEFDKLLVEPRLNIRQQISTVFALKLEASLRTKLLRKLLTLKMIF
jgi:hypothetical protein